MSNPSLSQYANPTLSLPPSFQITVMAARIRITGVMFNGLNPIPFDDVLDCPAHCCFNCRRADHRRKSCPDPIWPNPICYNCGREHVTIADCPRCKDAYVLHVERQNARIRREAVKAAEDRERELAELRGQVAPPRQETAPAPLAPSPAVPPLPSADEFPRVPPVSSPPMSLPPGAKLALTAVREVMGRLGNPKQRDGFAIDLQRIVQHRHSY